MLNLQQLLGEMDTIDTEIAQQRSTYTEYIAPYYHIRKYAGDTLPRAGITITDTNLLTALNAFDANTRLQVFENAMNRARNIKNFTEVSEKQIFYKNREKTGYLIEVYRKFTLSVACVVLYFIGAPLGSIIRKGGLGWPLFYSVLFFMLYHVTSIIGEKLAENGVLNAFNGMWLSTFILLPLGIFLTLKASADSKFFTADFYRNLLLKLMGKPVIPAAT